MTDAHNTPHIHLIGQGVISSLLATHALLEHIPFTQYVRSERGAPLVQWLSGEQYALPQATEMATVAASNERLAGIIIIPTKAYQISNALHDLQGLIADDAVLVLLHNGMGTHETARTMFPQHNIYAATTSMAGYAFKQAHSNKPYLKHTAWGKTHIGKIQNGTAEGTLGETQINKHDLTLKQLSKMIPDLHVSSSILETLYTKLAVNAVINPLTAIHDIKNGRLAEASYLPTMQSITKEIVMLGKRQNIKLSFTQIWNTVLGIVHATQNNYSSMHQDIAHKRRTEIDFINGFVVREAQKIGLSVPENETLLKHIHILEERL